MPRKPRYYVPGVPVHVARDAIMKITEVTEERREAR